MPREMNAPWMNTTWINAPTRKPPVDEFTEVFFEIFLTNKEKNPKKWRWYVVGN